jgi:hypothetical protein
MRSLRRRPLFLKSERIELGRSFCLASDPSNNYIDLVADSLKVLNIRTRYGDWRKHNQDKGFVEKVK